MKNLVVLVFMALLSSASIAGENPKNLYKEINRKIYVDLSEIELERNTMNYVQVQFKVVNQVVEIISLDGTKPMLESMIKEKLSELYISSECDEETIFNYRFTFEKE